MQESFKLYSATEGGTGSENFYEQGNEFTKLIRPLRATKISENDEPHVQLLSESALAKEWLSKEEDDAWAHL